jgi:hypothetical protein
VRLENINRPPQPAEITSPLVGVSDVASVGTDSDSETPETDTGRAARSKRHVSSLGTPHRVESTLSGTRTTARRASQNTQGDREDEEEEPPGSSASADPQTGLPRRNSLFAVASMPAFKHKHRKGGGGRSAANAAGGAHAVRPDVHLRRALTRRAVTSAHAGFVSAVDDVVLFLETRTDRAVEMLALSLHQLLDGVAFEEHDCETLFTMYPSPPAYLCVESAKIPQEPSRTPPTTTFDGAAPSSPFKTPGSPVKALASQQLTSSSGNTSNELRIDRDANAEARLPPTVPEVEELHPLLLPLQVVESYADLHCASSVASAIAPLLQLLTDPEFRLYSYDVVRADSAPTDAASATQVHSPAIQSPNISSPMQHGKPSAQFASPSPRPPPPSAPGAASPPATSSRRTAHQRLRMAAQTVRAVKAVADSPQARQREDDGKVIDSVRNALSQLALRLASSGGPSAVDDAMPDRAGSWFPAGAQYLFSLFAALVSERVLQIVSKVGEGSDGIKPAGEAGGRPTTFAERLGIRLTKPVHAGGHGSQPAEPATFTSTVGTSSRAFETGRGDPAMYPKISFPMAELSQVYKDSQNPLIQGLLHARVQRFLLLERLVCRYLLEPEKYGLLPANIAALAPTHNTAKHVVRNCKALAYYLSCAARGRAITELFTVQVCDTTQSWSRESASITPDGGIPLALQPLVKTETFPRRRRALAREHQDLLDFRGAGDLFPSAVAAHRERLASHEYQSRRWSVTGPYDLEDEESTSAVAASHSFVWNDATGTYAASAGRAGEPRERASTTDKRLSNSAAAAEGPKLPKWLRALMTNVVTAAASDVSANAAADKTSPPFIGFLLEHFCLFAASPLFALDSATAAAPSQSLAASVNAPAGALVNLQMTAMSASSRTTPSDVFGTTNRWRNRILSAAAATTRQQDQDLWPRGEIITSAVVVPHFVVAAAVDNLLGICKAHDRDFCDALEAAAKRLVPMKVKAPQLTAAGGGLEEAELVAIAMQLHGHSSQELSNALVLAAHDGGNAALGRAQPHRDSSDSSRVPGIAGVDAAGVFQRRKDQSLFDHSYIFGAATDTVYGAVDATQRGSRVFAPATSPASAKSLAPPGLTAGGNSSVLLGNTVRTATMVDSEPTFAMSNLSTAGLSRSFINALHEAATGRKTMRTAANMVRSVAALQQRALRTAVEAAAAAQRRLDNEFYEERVELIVDRAKCALRECSDAGQVAFQVKVAAILSAAGVAPPGATPIGGRGNFRPRRPSTSSVTATK